MHTNFRRFGLGLGSCLVLLLSVVNPVAAANPQSDNEAAVKAKVNSFVAGPPGVGTVATVHLPTGELHLAAGLRNADKNITASTQDRARISSVTKSMTATLVMQEIEKGTWTINTTIDEVIPGLYPGHGNVTVGQLMNHTSGMPDAIWKLLQHRSFWDVDKELLLPTVQRHYRKEELVKIAQSIGWHFEPGTNWSYSNTGYVVLSMMLEKANRSPIELQMRRNIFQKAGMKSAAMGLGLLAYEPTFVDYAQWKDGSKTALDPIDLSIFSGAGAVYATSEDITKFYRSLMTGKLVGQQYVDQMIAPVGAAAKIGYGYGIFSVADPCPAPGQPYLVGHDGAGFGSVALALTSRDGSRSAAVMISGRQYNPNGPFPDLEGFYQTAFACPGKQTQQLRPGELSKLLDHTRIG